MLTSDALTDIVLETWQSKEARSLIGGNPSNYEKAGMKEVLKNHPKEDGFAHNCEKFKGKLKHVLKDENIDIQMNELQIEERHALLIKC